MNELITELHNLQNSKVVESDYFTENFSVKEDKKKMRNIFFNNKVERNFRQIFSFKMMLVAKLYSTNSQTSKTKI